MAGFKVGSIRPTSDRVREAVFSSLFSQIGQFYQKKVLDLYAGTGAMAIEALSRGAESATLVDQSRDAGNLINQNLDSTGLKDKATFLCGDVKNIIPQLGQRKKSFDLIFIDPPYADGSIEEILHAVNSFGLLQTDGIICVETASKAELSDKIGALICFDRRKYGSTAVSYYRYDTPEDNEA